MFYRTCLSLCLLLPGIAAAAPMAPSDRDISSYFSEDVQADFVLLADSDNDQLVYYIPKKGGISVDARRSLSPIPRFQIYDYVPTFGTFANSVLTRIGGSFDTTAHLDSLSLLHQEAAASGRGLRVTPAPATTATTKFLLGTHVLEGQRLQAQCHIEVSTLISSSGQEREVRTPQCNIAGEDGIYDVDTNVMYKFSTFPALGNSVVSQNIPFAGVTLPDKSSELRPILATGGQWSGVLSAVVDWEVKANTRTRQARAIINWSSTFEQASAFMAIHNNACIDVEMQAFYRNLATCDNADDCGVRIEYLDENTNQWTHVAPDDPEFINQVSSFQQVVENELFNQVNAYTTSALGEVSKEKTAYFTLRANYEKQILNRNETKYFTWTPGNKTVKASTDLQISCLKGGFESGRVTWNMDDPGCKALLGQ